MPCLLMDGSCQTGSKSKTHATAYQIFHYTACLIPPLLVTLTAKDFFSFFAIPYWMWHIGTLTIAIPGQPPTFHIGCRILPL